jgi:phosphopantothenoylcysteine synthetase/decarboxylase
LKSNDPIAFVDSLRERIVKTPKILKEIKVWNSKCKLISFKFEVGLTPEELIEIATKAGLDNHCDLVIANDKKQMQLHKSHIAFAIDPYDPKNQVILYDKNEIADYIYSIC